MTVVRDARATVAFSEELYRAKLSTGYHGKMRHDLR